MRIPEVGRYSQNNSDCTNNDTCWCPSIAVHTKFHYDFRGVIEVLVKLSIITDQVKQIQLEY